MPMRMRWMTTMMKREKVHEPVEWGGGGVTFGLGFGV